MKRIMTGQQRLGRSIAVLFLLAVALAGTVTRDRMDMAMASAPHDMTMVMDQFTLDHAMSSGSAHAACQIICVGTTPAVSAAMPVSASRLIVADDAARVTPRHNGRSTDPARHPPKTALTA